ncbi:BMP family lipoprotein [Spirochaeta thermophila]|uniref:Putative membrane lipoprotein tmpC n=1 Tax=Winmispira thermophila (strain ATCC 49972 / DSM 6192 / RI 19.B1) TaxID=665571 RepID=E0RP48_WINT6|nr:BMP family ABC transporter substrate-binding protein [Spirochaeta thermophila]ADN02710.1 putative membrane lipoprotein tmpC precursor [Spirochaeta thermophila DSM 6192]
MRRSGLIFLIMAVLLVFFPACGQKKEAKIEEPSFRVGLVTDVGGIDDRSFNQGTWEGIVRFGKEMGLEEGVGYKYLQSSQEADYVPNLATFADEGLDLIVAPGFLFQNAVAEVAKQYPDRKFLVIDTVVEAPNVVSAVFAEHEGSFLVGVAAGLKAKQDGKNVVGFLGGMQFPLIEKFQAGFEAGVKAVYPECTILVDYAGDFAAPDKGQAIAQKQFNAGAYIIFHAAGGTGNGMIKEAKERSQKGDIRWAIGVDKDQYQDGIYGEGTSAVLTSMVKRVDVAAYTVAKMTMEGNFPGGQTLAFSLKNDGVGLPAENPNLSPEILAVVEEYAKKIASGELVVPDTPKK